MKKVVEVNGVYFGYDKGLVLENINLDIFEGDYVGIIGPNGSAKSTLIKLMLDILKPDRGTIRLFGEDINFFKDWGKVGYVAQKAASFNTSFPATVEEVVGANLFSRIGLFKPIKPMHLEMVHRALKVVGMEEYRNRLIGNLSGGQQQKVFIARALVSSPEIIFLDEPTVGIDVKSQQEFYELLDKLNKEFNITIVMVSHDVGVITERAGRIACMGDRRLIVHSGSSQEDFDKILKSLYGENMKVLIHNH